MIIYPKIQSIFKRNPKTHYFIENEFSSPEFSYLSNNNWIFTEKIDGTNVRIDWNHETKQIEIGGRTDNAQMPISLLKRLNDLFPIDKFESTYPDVSMTLFGEGFGKGIQSRGSNYLPYSVDFVLFDVYICDLWLEFFNITDIAEKLLIIRVPYIGVGTLKDMVTIIKNGLNSTYGDFEAEGIVAKPAVNLLTRRGQRIITKIKCSDFKTNGENL